MELTALSHVLGMLHLLSSGICLDESVEDLAPSFELAVAEH